jgi:hypothetical protein
VKSKRIHKLLSNAMFILVSCYCTNLFSQVKIGGNPTSINPNSVVEIESNDKGLLLPRLSLFLTTASTPLSSFVEGMFVYNIATVNDITPGIYYSDGSKWIKVNAGYSSSASWNLSGNSGTNVTEHFLGTTDLSPLVIKTNATERLRITEDGWVGIGTSTPESALHVKGQLIIDSLNAGDLTTDNLLVVNPADGRIKTVPSNSFIVGSLKRTVIVLTSSQLVFDTPDVITDINKILLFRNGVMISFFFNNSRSIISEIPCVQGDEIYIVQLK